MTRPLHRTALLLVLLAFALPMIASDFSDNFEAALLNPFWTPVQQYGTVSLTTQANHTPGGSQSLMFSSAYGGQRSMEVYHSFGSAVKGNLAIMFEEFRATEV